MKIPFTFYGRFAPNAHLLHFFPCWCSLSNLNKHRGTFRYKVRIYIYIFFGARVNFQSEEAEFDKEGRGGRSECVFIMVNWIDQMDMSIVTRDRVKAADLIGLRCGLFSCEAGRLYCI